MKRRKTFDFLSVIKYLFLFLFYLAFGSITTPPTIFSTAILTSSIALGFHFISSPLLYLLSFVAIGRNDLLLPALISVGVILVIFFAYKIKRRTIGAEIFLYTLLSLLGFVFLNPVSLTKNITESIITSFISVVFYVGAKAFIEKGVKYKLGYEELLTIFISIALFGVGISNLISPHVWKSVSLIFLLICCFIYKLGTGSLISAVLGLSLAIYYQNVNYVSLYLIYALAIESLMPFSRHAGAFLVVGVDYGVHMIFGIYGSYGVYECISTVLGAILFCIIPKQLLLLIKEKITLFKEKQLTRQSINRNRIMTANRLYELSNVFLEISNSFNIFKDNALDEKKFTSFVVSHIKSSVCGECSNLSHCQANGIPNTADINKMVQIGLAKNKISFIDVPSNFSNNCIHVSDAIYGINKMLADWKNQQLEKINLNNGREILGNGAKGVSEILSGLAFECGSQLKYQNQLEKSIGENLYKAGFNVSELLCYGEKSNLRIGLVLSMKEFSLPLLLKIMSKSVGMDLSVIDKSIITDDKCYLFLGKSTPYDAVFGLSTTKKDGSVISGDTHAVTRIGQDRFLIALSDGMGSGNIANDVSSASLSLIESFYKAGLSTPLILKTVNKLLSINTDDVFTALDVAVINLYDCRADFIKYGAPYGFIIGDKTVRIVEGSSLPMGILNDLSPAVCQADLSDGDIILLTTDGITDSFGSISDMIEFLQTLPALNPQTLTDTVLKKALDLTNGKKADDMSALAVRIFKKESILEG